MITFKSFKCAFENEVVKEKMKKTVLCFNYISYVS